MDNIHIKRLEPFAENEQGSTYELEGATVEGFLLAYRKAGSVSGNHWHKGHSKGKNPEVIILVSGNVELYAQDRNSKEELKQIIHAPARIEIYPNVLHTITALSDCCFVELNSLEEHKADTFYSH